MPYLRPTGSGHTGTTADYHAQPCYATMRAYHIQQQAAYSLRSSCNLCLTFRSMHYEIFVFRIRAALVLCILEHRLAFRWSQI